MFDKYKNKIKTITDKIGNVCNIGPGKICNSKTTWRKPGVGCCHDCQYHSEKGCTTESLICMAWYCEFIQKEIPEETVTELCKIIDELSAKGLEVRQSKEEQVKLLGKY